MPMILYTLGNNTYLTANYNDASDNAGIYLASTSSGEIRKLEGCSNGLPTNKPWLFFYDDGIMSIMTRPYENRLMEWKQSHICCGFYCRTVTHLLAGSRDREGSNESN